MRRSVTKPCAAPACSRYAESFSGEWCRVHRYRVERYGSPDDPRTTRPCRVCGEPFQPARADSTVCTESACRAEAKRLDDRAFERSFKTVRGVWRSEVVPAPVDLAHLAEAPLPQGSREAPDSLPAPIQIFTLSEVGDRDGWVCGWCAEPIERDVLVTEP